MPKQTASQRDAVFGGIPQIDDSNHTIFTEQVKLEPFRRAMKEHQPDVWFTNIRKGQTAWRNSLDILSFSKDGILKVSPFQSKNLIPMNHTLESEGIHIFREVIAPFNNPVLFSGGKNSITLVRLGSSKSIFSRTNSFSHIAY